MFSINLNACRAGEAASVTHGVFDLFIRKWFAAIIFCYFFLECSIFAH